VLKTDNERNKVRYDEPLAERPTFVGHAFFERLIETVKLHY